MSNLKAITDERGSQYGDFRHQAELAQGLKKLVREHIEIHGIELKPFQAEALDMILHKVSRICNGNPDNLDSWLDIAGYATITYERLPREDSTEPVPVKAPRNRRRFATG